MSDILQRILARKAEEVAERCASMKATAPTRSRADSATNSSATKAAAVRCATIAISFANLFYILCPKNKLFI